MKQSEALSIMKMGKNIFLTGAAGAGKTYVLNQYIQYLRSHSVKVAITASTGIAATHLGGQTIHSWSGIGVAGHMDELDAKKILDSPRYRPHYKKTKVLIIDEISMLSGDQLDMVDSLAKKFVDPFAPFGGMQVVLCGDFFQLPPIHNAGEPTPFAYDSAAWREGGFEICYLDEQHRQGNDPLLGVLNSIRDACVGEDVKEALRTRYNKEPVVPNNLPIKPTILYARNINVDAYNAKQLEQLNQREKVFEMKTSGVPNVVDAMKKSCLAPDFLRLKIGAQVMFVKNNIMGTYVNGTRAVVVSFDSETGFPIVETLNGKRIIASPVSWSYDELDTATITQVPLRLAWAITIHKSQGMTLDVAEIDLTDAFEPGMGYVALSRVRSLNGLKLMGFNETALLVNQNVLAHNDIFLQQSQRAATDLQVRSDQAIVQEQQKVLTQRFGVTDDANDTPLPIQLSEGKMNTYDKTAILLRDGLSLQAIAQRRELKISTIIAHLERLKNLGMLTHIKHLKSDLNLSEKEFNDALTLFHNEEMALSQLFEHFNQRISYETLRVVRLFKVI